MTYYLRFTIIIIIMLVYTQGMAQIPPMHIKPEPSAPKDTLQQVIETRVPDYETLTDPKNNSTVYKGIFSYNDLVSKPFFSWLPKGMDEYEPKAKSIKYLENHIRDYKLLIFLGTWCGDSKDLIPKLYKVLDELNIGYEDIMLVGMDRAKTTNTATGKHLTDKYKVTLLPTIILIGQNGEEAGRITESVNKSVEQDMAAIIKSVK